MYSSTSRRCNGEPLIHIVPHGPMGTSILIVGMEQSNVDEEVEGEGLIALP